MHMSIFVALVSVRDDFLLEGLAFNNRVNSDFSDFFFCLFHTSLLLFNDFCLLPIAFVYLCLFKC